MKPTFEPHHSQNGSMDLVRKNIPTDCSLVSTKLKLGDFMFDWFVFISIFLWGIFDVDPRPREKIRFTPR
jgi:hypothetical protein